MFERQTSIVSCHISNLSRRSVFSNFASTSKGTERPPRLTNDDFNKTQPWWYSTRISQWRISNPASNIKIWHTVVEMCNVCCKHVQQKGSFFLTVNWCQQTAVRPHQSDHVFHTGLSKHHKNTVYHSTEKLQMSVFSEQWIWLRDTLRGVNSFCFLTFSIFLFIRLIPFSLICTNLSIIIQTRWWWTIRMKSIKFTIQRDGEQAQSDFSLSPAVIHSGVCYWHVHSWTTVCGCYRERYSICLQIYQ